MSDDVVHNRIAVLRADRRVSRRELAEALGVHYQTVGYLERGEYAPSLHLALRIARYFDVPVESVFSLEEFPRLTYEDATHGNRVVPSPDREGTTRLLGSATRLRSGADRPTGGPRPGPAGCRSGGW